MAKNKFLKDKADGERGQEVALAYLKSKLPSLKFFTTIGKDSRFDIYVTVDNEEPTEGFVDILDSWEVKFDKMCSKTQNLCFEISNGFEPTGILKSEAISFIYVIPKGKNKYTILEFGRSWLVASLLYSVVTNKLVKQVSGGDDNRFKLLLVKLEDAKKFGAKITDNFEYKGA